MDAELVMKEFHAIFERENAKFAKLVEEFARIQPADYSSTPSLAFAADQARRMSAALFVQLAIVLPLYSVMGSCNVELIANVVEQYKQKLAPVVPNLPEPGSTGDAHFSEPTTTVPPTFDAPGSSILP